eukprot:66813_1
MANLGNFRAYLNADCKGDKIKLPQSASERLLSIPNITYPLCFELSVPISREEILNAMQNGLSKPQRKFIHCGVLDFTASEGCVCVPSWIMDNLGVSESCTLTVSNITLPKGRYVRLQPHTLLKDTKTKQQLESSLRNFTTLTANTTITIQSMNDLKLNVLEVKPNKNNLNSIQIIDCDLVVEFEAALDGTTNDVARFERNLVLNGTDHKEDIITDAVAKGEYRFYTLELTQTIESIQIKATPSVADGHDVDLYASWTYNEPGTTATNYDYHCVESGAVQLIIHLDENQSKYLYLAVHGFDASQMEHKEQSNPIEYTLSVHNISISGTELKQLYRASSLTQHDEAKQAQPTSSTDNDGIKPDTETPMNADPNKTFCANCHRFVNKWSYDRHHAHCIKQFEFCISCKKVIKMNDMEAHNKTFHSDLKCKICGEMISGGKQTLISHQKHECLKRPVNCDYCHLPFAFIEYEQHRIMCGSRTEFCVHCNQYIALSLIEQHCIDAHGVPYEIPSGIARMKSEDEEDPNAMQLGGFGAPQRNYEDMNDTEDRVKSTGHERWICSSCDYNNRPNHTQCKICKTNRTKYMKTVSEMDKEAKKASNTNKSMDKIGGNVQQIPQRNYNDMMTGAKDSGGDAYAVSIKPPLMQYYDKQRMDEDDSHKKEDAVIASGVDPAMIPQRDYEKMLNDNDEEDEVDMVDIQHDVDQDEEDTQMKLSTNVDNIPHRDYEEMLNKQVQHDEAQQEQQWIEHFAKEAQQSDADAQANVNQYRAGGAVIPQRNYDKMFQNKSEDQDVDMNQNNKTEPVQAQAMATTSTGYWLCPSSECEHLNKATRNNCSVCHTLKPTYRRTAELLDDSVEQLGLDHRWVCKNCDGLNKGSRNKCVYCKEVKSYRPNSKVAARKAIEATKKKKKGHGIFDDVERWVCPNEECNFLNKGSRLKCQVCHSERADQHVLWGDRAKTNEANDDTTTTHTDTNVNNANVSNDNSNKKKTSYSHPLEARMMGASAQDVQNVAPLNSNNRETMNNQGGSEWQCPICTFLNTKSQCEMCGCPRDAQ